MINMKEINILIYHISEMMMMEMLERIDLGMTTAENTFVFGDYDINVECCCFGNKVTITDENCRECNCPNFIGAILRGLHTWDEARAQYDSNECEEIERYQNNLILQGY